MRFFCFFLFFKVTFSMVAQVSDSVLVCDSNFIMDYRMIYDDYTSDLTNLLETKLDERYNVFISYWGNEDSAPEDMLISLTIAGYIEFETFMLVCKAEELFQKGLLVEYLKDKFSQ